MGLERAIPKKCDAVTQERRWRAAEKRPIVSLFLFGGGLPTARLFLGPLRPRCSVSVKGFAAIRAACAGWPRAAVLLSGRRPLPSTNSDSPRASGERAGAHKRGRCVTRETRRPRSCSSLTRSSPRCKVKSSLAHRRYSLEDRQSHSDQRRKSR